jgi:hypothetical protein
VVSSVSPPRKSQKGKARESSTWKHATLRQGPSHAIFKFPASPRTNSRARFTRSTPTEPPACKAKGKRDPGTSDAPTLLLKRIAQTDLGQVAQSWQNLCVKSGGKRDPANDPCVVLAGVNGINSLLAGAGACAQQDNADAMIDFAKSPGITNKQALIDNAIAYRKHPRNALDIGGTVPSTPFCEKAPRNPELKGVVNAQLSGVNPGLFGGPNFAIVPFGACKS